MIKIFSNKTSLPKIEVESKFVRNKTEVITSDYLSDFNERDLLFVKLTFKDLSSSQKIDKVRLALVYQNAREITTGLKVIKTQSTDLSESNLKSIASSITGKEKVLEQAVIYGSTNSLSKSRLQARSLDITNIVKMSNNINPVVMLIIKSDLPFTTTGFTFHSPEKVAEENEICTTTMYEVAGYSPIYQYDEHNLEGCGKTYINLNSGKYIHALNLFTTPSKKIPVSYSLYANLDKTISPNIFFNKLYPNYSFNIYSLGDDFVIEDATGFKNYYQKVSEIEKAPYIYGIKHTDITGELYLSLYDYSYFYLITDEKEIKTIKLFDKQDNHTVFKVDEKGTKILKYENNLGYILNYNWNGNMLESITHNNQLEMEITYSTNKTQVKFPNYYRQIEINEEINSKITTIKLYEQEKETPNLNLIKEIKFNFNESGINKIENVMKEQSLVLNYTNNLVTSVGIYNKTETKKNYITSYTYNSKFTKVSDLEGNILFYYFDNSGRVKMIMDKEARTITYNYDEYENGESKNLIGVSNVQNNSRNILENHSFEDENIFKEESLTWQKEASENTIIKIVNEGVIGGKSLMIETDTKSTTRVYQNITKTPTEPLILKGFIKHPNPSELTSSNIKIGIIGAYNVKEPIIESTDTGFIIVGTRTVKKFVNSYGTLDFSKTSWYAFETPKVTLQSGAFNINLRVELTVSNAHSVIYLDDLQLTDSTYFTRYNLIENGYMEYLDLNNKPKGWNFTNFSSNDQVIEINPTEDHPYCLGKKVMKISESEVQKDDTLKHYQMKKMEKTIQVKGFKGEEFVYSVFAKANVTDNMIFRSYIDFNYERMGHHYYQFDFDKNFDNWQVLTRSIITEDNYNDVTVGIEFNGGVEVLLDCFQLYKDSLGKQYNYDNKGNIVEVVESNGVTSRISYNDYNQINEIYASDGSFYKYSYDEEGRLKEASDLFGNKVTLEYDENERIIKETIKTIEAEELTKAVEYDDNNNQETYTNELGKKFIINKDYLDRIIKETNFNNVKKEFNYTKKSELEKLSIITGDIISSNNLTYNQKGQLETIYATNGTIYQLTYDEFGNILTITCDGKLFQQNEYKEEGGYYSGELIKRIVGTNQYEFTYNKIGQVSEIKKNGELIIKLKYDETGNLYEISDETTKISTHYTYDLKGQLLHQRTNNNKEITYEYDNLSNIQKVTYQLNNKVRSIDYQYDYELNAYTKESLLNRLSTSYHDEMIISSNGTNGLFGIKPRLDTTKKVIDQNLNMKVIEIENDCHFLWYDLKKANKNRKSDLIDGKYFSSLNWEARFVYNKTFYALVKPTKTSVLSGKTTIFTLQTFNEKENKNHFISELYLDSSGKIFHRSNGNTGVTKATNTTFKLDEWNLIGIKIYKEKDASESMCKIILNEEVTEPFILGENVIDINHLLVGYQKGLNEASKLEETSFSYSNNNKLKLKLDICLVSMGSYDYQNSDFKAIYNESKKYLLTKGINKISSTNYYDESVYQDFDVITLNGNLKSTKGLVPYNIATMDTSYKLDKNKMFKYDLINEKHVFGSYSGTLNLINTTDSLLTYKLGLKKQGTISLYFKADSKVIDEQYTNQKRYIISNLINQTEKLGIYLNNENTIKIMINEIEEDTKITPSLDTWHYLGISFANENITIALDGTIITTKDTNIDLTDTLTYIGSSKKIDSIQLNGCIEMLAFKNAPLTQEELKEMNIKGRAISVKDKLDFLGRLTETQFNTNGRNFNIIYEYDKILPISEKYGFGDECYYTFNDMGNITSKTYKKYGNNQSQITYEYDEVGRLIKEVQENGDIETYTYDTNGNMLTHKVKRGTNYIVDEEYLYESPHGFCDELTSVKNKLTDKTVKTLKYEGEDQFIPTSMTLNGNLKELTWEGRKLTTIGRDIKYTYNGNNQRIKKETLTENTTFEYEGANVISMDKDTPSEKVTLDFVYDARGKLIGLNTVEGSYFYHKDITGNIIGLVDNSGTYVVKYSYNAWGKTQKTIVTSCIASRHNPFIYKGYYNDEETQLYWVSSRYYSPELCRWISPDSIEYLDPESINGLNLYAYCGNDPVNKYDPTGHIAISLIVGLVVSFAIGTTASAISQYVQYGDVNWLQAGVDGLFAVASTALAYTGIGLIGSIAAGAGIGLAQYTLDSAVFHDDFSWSGALIATGLGALGGLASGRGAQHFKSIGSNLDDTGRTGVKAILTAFDKYGTGAGYQKVMNLWGGRVANSLAKSISQNFTKSALIIWGTTAATYGLSYGLGQIDWGF